MERTRGNVISREQCPSCNDKGRDNLIIYDNGSKHCHACSHHVFADDEEQEGIIAMNPDLIRGHCTDLGSRGITKTTCEHFNYEVGKNKKGEVVHIANYFNDKGEKVAQKIRGKGKKFSALGDTTQALLFGQQLYSPKDNVFITVVEGELDALSVAEAQGKHFPVVSIPSGAGGAKRELSKHLEYLSKFKHVVLLFDQDEAGQKATAECIDLFEPGKVRIAKIPLKDANDMVKAGRAAELRSALFNAKEVRPTGLLSIKDILEDGLEPPTMGIPWGFSKLDEITYGMQRGAVYTICAGSGSGKTIFLRDVVASLVLNNNVKCVVMSFEQTSKDVLLRMAGYKMNKILHRPDATFNIEEVERELSSFEGKLFIHNNADLPTPESLYNKLRYYVKYTGAQVITIDNITALAASMKDERQGIDKMMAELGKIAVELNVTVIVVSHLAKPEGKSFEEGKTITASSLRGSQSIMFWSSMILGLERNKLAEEESERNTLTIRVLKDRMTGEADGKTVQLRYDTDTGKLSEWIELDAEDII